MPGQRFTFGPFLLNPDAGTLLREGEPVAVGQRGIMLLEAFLKRPGEVLSKGELLDAAWSGAAVEESNLSVQIASLRKHLGRSDDGGDWISTIPRVGYRFVGIVEAPQSAVASTVAPNIPTPSPRSRSCLSPTSATIPNRSILPRGSRMTSSPVSRVFAGSW